MMMRAIVILALLGAVQGAPVAKAAPLAAKKVEGRVQLSAEQQRTMHSGCVSACRPSPVESKCVTACEAAMYKCIDETGPNETPKDTKKCQDGVLKLYTDTKGVEKKEEKKEEKKGAKKEGKKDAKKADKKKSFLQIEKDDEDELSEDSSDFEDDGMSADETATMEEETSALDEESQDDGAEMDADSEDEATEEDSESSDEDQAAIEEEEASEASEDGSEEDSSEDDEAAEDVSATEDEEDSSMEDESSMDEEQDDSQLEDEEGASDEESEDADDAESLVQTGSSWKPEPGTVALYKHPQGSTVVTPCPVSSFTSPEACTAYFGGKADGDKCPQITCPKALGVTMKLTCGGGCCPTCWAPDHIIAVDRHTSIDDAAVVDAAPQAPGTCGGVKCFKLGCAPGFSEGFVNGDCCYSCVQGR